MKMRLSRFTSACVCRRRSSENITVAIPRPADQYPLLTWYWNRPDSQPRANPARRDDHGLLP